MGLDIRLPIGMMFTLLGGSLAIYGLVTSADSDMYKCSLDLNINLWWGLVLLVFGATMLTFALLDRATKIHTRKSAIINANDPRA